MELQAYYALLRKNYQMVMCKFAYQGKEPEAKKRLRYLFSNQLIHISYFSPEPEDWNTWTEMCVQNEDWSGLCRIINQRMKAAMMPVIYGGYTYENNFVRMLECFACGNVHVMERILPLELAQVKNCHNPFFLTGIHLLIGMWYQDKAVLEWAVPEVERFLERKKSNMLEKSIVAFLLDLISGDMNQGSEDLLAVCKVYPKQHCLGVRPYCIYAHGLYCLAQLLLPEDIFQTLEMPKYKNFLLEFALWRKEHSAPDLTLWVRYPDDLALFNQIYEAPSAKLILWKPDPGDKKQEWFAHGVKWVDIIWMNFGIWASVMNNRFHFCLPRKQQSQPSQLTIKRNGT